MCPFPIKELKSSNVVLIKFIDSQVCSVLTLIPKMPIEVTFVHGPKLKLSIEGLTKPFALKVFMYNRSYLQYIQENSC